MGKCFERLAGIGKSAGDEIHELHIAGLGELSLRVEIAEEL